MLQVSNQTPFVAALSVFPDPNGIETAYAVVKATFALGAAQPELAVQQVPLIPTDVYWGDPQQTSLRAAGEFALLKPSTDVLLVGRAVAPAPGTRVADVRVRVGPVQKTVRVFGERHWEGVAGNLQPSEAQPWERVPLRWELAFGGVAADAADPCDHEPRNPIGRGIVSRDSNAVRGHPLPQLEDPAHPIRSPRDRPPPACFAPIAPTWLPRRTHAGTYDDAWISGRAPYLPRDFDPRFFQVAPEGLIAPGHLQGGEPVELIGFTLGGPLAFTLPIVQLTLTFQFEGRPEQRPVQLEAVTFEPDHGRFQMLWRAALRVDKKLLKLSELEVRCEQYDRDGRPSAPLRSLQGLPRSYAAPVS